MIGYLLEQSLLQCDPGLRVVTLVTQTMVAEDDPAFASPSKPIGPMYDAATAQQLAETRGFEVARDGEGVAAGRAVPRATRAARGRRCPLTRRSRVPRRRERRRRNARPARLPRPAERRRGRRRQGPRRRRAGAHGEAPSDCCCSRTSTASTTVSARHRPIAWARSRPEKRACSPKVVRWAAGACCPRSKRRRDSRNTVASP